MAAAGVRKSSEELDRIKKNINTSYQYFKPNYDRFHQYRRLVFMSSLTEEDRNILIGRKMPTLEFNILEAYISRLLGEFAKHEPSIAVVPADGAPVDIQTSKLVEGHLRHIIYESNKNSTAYEIYKDLLSGGFSVAKMWVDYASPMSFNKVINLGRAFDPTLCGFDPMAQFSHKADGRYSFENYPMAQDEFEQKFPNVSTAALTYSRKVEQFNWSYMNGAEEIVMLSEYFEKKQKRARIVKLSNNRVMTTKDYERFEEYWKKEQFIEQIPQVVGKSRMTDMETICRYRLIESEIIDYKETDYTYLPHIFVDGNSIMIRNGDANSVQQMTRPYVYHALGVQKLKNFAGQTLANELENTIQHKFIVMKEAIPQEEEYIDALTNSQQASTLVVNAYSENDPDKPIPNPIREVVRTPIPPEIMQAYSVTDGTSQVILGSFDASLGINDNQLSGVAIQEGATQSNSAAMPYITGFLQAWSHIGNMAADLMPKYMDTPRTIPVVGVDGKRTYQQINMKGAPSFDYDENALNVEITAGVNFQIAKNQALQQIIAMMRSSEVFAQFMNTDGLPVLLKNLTIYGADELQELAEEWQQKMAAQAKQQQAMQAHAMLNDPKVLTAKAKMAEVQNTARQDQAENALRAQELAIDDKEAENERMRIIADLKESEENVKIEAKRDETEKLTTAMKMAMDHAKQKHEERMDHHELQRKLSDQAHKHASERQKITLDTVELKHNMSKPIKEMQNANEKGI